MDENKIPDKISYHKLIFNQGLFTDIRRCFKICINDMKYNNLTEMENICSSINFKIIIYLFRKLFIQIFPS